MVLTNRLVGSIDRDPYAISFSQLMFEITFDNVFLNNTTGVDQCIWFVAVAIGTVFFHECKVFMLFWLCLKTKRLECKDGATGDRTVGAMPPSILKRFEVQGGQYYSFGHLVSTQSLKECLMCWSIDMGLDVLLGGVSFCNQDLPWCGGVCPSGVAQCVWFVVSNVGHSGGQGFKPFVA